nr:MAG TPA: hypothetical protein [Bacteriophage sp.]
MQTSVPNIRSILFFIINLLIFNTLFTSIFYI